ncbi:DUF7017 domain-containing protein [Kaistella sp.]|uniref:DUF7017 domain-containing protein n=1 Tax=Kaistella sp. TaxID=2782235 RepID=UPI002F94ECAC
MRSSQVKELRKNGQLQEALTMALQDFEKDPENLWNKRALSWVYYDLLKKHAEEHNYASFIETLEKVKEMAMPADEKMFFENLAWPLSTMFRFLAKENTKDYGKINSLYRLTKEFPIPRPAKPFSVLYAAIHKAYKDFVQYTEVIDDMGIENLLSEDFEEEEYNGKKNMSLAEQVYIAYAKHLAEGKPIDPYGNREIDVQKIKEFLPLLDELIDKYPDYLYPPYFKAKLLLKLGAEDIMSSFLPFARKKKGEYWVWQLLAEIYKDKPEIVFASYCKALSLRSKDDFLVKIRQSLAGLLIQQKMYSEAKTEVERILAVKTAMQTRIPNEVQMWIASDWYKTTEKRNDNFSLYNHYAPQAEELLFADIPEETVVVEFVNRDRKILNFVKDQDKKGFFKYDRLLRDPQIGDVLKVRFRENPSEGRYMVYTVKKGNPEECNALTIVNGDLRIIPAGIGFIDDVFVDKSVIAKFNLTNAQQINGKAILSFNKTKNQWGWKLISIS